MNLAIWETLFPVVLSFQTQYRFANDNLIKEITYYISIAQHRVLILRFKWMKVLSHHKTYLGIDWNNFQGASVWMFNAILPAIMILVYHSCTHKFHMVYTCTSQESQVIDSWLVLLWWYNNNSVVAVNIKYGSAFQIGFQKYTYIATFTFHLPFEGLLLVKLNDLQINMSSH